MWCSWSGGGGWYMDPATSSLCGPALSTPQSGPLSQGRCTQQDSSSSWLAQNMLGSTEAGRGGRLSQSTHCISKAYEIWQAMPRWHDRSWTGPEKRGTLSGQDPHPWQVSVSEAELARDAEPSVFHFNISESLGAYPTRKIWKEHRIPPPDAWYEEVKV